MTKDPYSAPRRDKPQEWKQRNADKMCARFTLFWDWVDKRQMDAWGVSIFTLWMSWRITEWAIGFAEAHPNGQVAGTIAAILGSWALLQTAVVGFVFNARKSSFEPKKEDIK